MYTYLTCLVNVMDSFNHNPDSFNHNPELSVGKYMAQLSLEDLAMIGVPKRRFQSGQPPTFPQKRKKMYAYKDKGKDKDEDEDKDVDIDDATDDDQDSDDSTMSDFSDGGGKGEGGGEEQAEMVEEDSDSGSGSNAKVKADSDSDAEVHDDSGGGESSDHGKVDGLHMSDDDMSDLQTDVVGEAELRAWFESTTAEERVECTAVVMRLRRSLIESQFNDLYAALIPAVDLAEHREQYVDIYEMQTMFAVNTFMTQSTYDKGVTEMFDVLEEEDEEGAGGEEMEVEHMAAARIGGWFTPVRRNPDQGLRPLTPLDMEMTEAELRQKMIHTASEDAAEVGNWWQSSAEKFYQATLGNWKTKVGLSILFRMGLETAIDSSIYMVGTAALDATLPVALAATLPASGVIVAGAYATLQIVSIVVRNRDLVRKWCLSSKKKVYGHSIGETVFRKITLAERSMDKDNGNRSTEFETVIIQRYDKEAQQYHVMRSTGETVETMAALLSPVPWFKAGTHIEFLDDTDNWRKGRILQSLQVGRTYNYEIETVLGKKLTQYPDKVRVLELPFVLRLVSIGADLFSVYFKYARMLSWQQKHDLRSVIQNAYFDKTKVETDATVKLLFDKVKAGGELTEYFAENPGFETVDEIVGMVAFMGKEGSVKNQIITDILEKNATLKDISGLATSWNADGGPKYIEDLHNQAEEGLTNLVMFEMFGNTEDVLTKITFEVGKIYRGIWSTIQTLASDPLVIWTVCLEASQQLKSLLHTVTWELWKTLDMLNKKGEALGDKLNNMRKTSVKDLAKAPFIVVWAGCTGAIKCFVEVFTFIINNFQTILCAWTWSTVAAGLKAGAAVVGGLTTLRMSHFLNFKGSKPMMPTEFFNSRTQQLWSVGTISYERAREYFLGQKTMAEGLLVNTGTMSMYSIAHLFKKTGSVALSDGISREFWKWVMLTNLAIQEWLVSANGQREAMWLSIPMGVGAMWARSRMDASIRSNVGVKESRKLYNQLLREQREGFSQGNNALKKVEANLTNTIRSGFQEAEEQINQKELQRARNAYEYFCEEYALGDSAQTKIRKGSDALTLIGDLLFIFSIWIRDDGFDFTKGEREDDKLHLSRAFWTANLAPSTHATVTAKQDVHDIGKVLNDDDLKIGSLQRKVLEIIFESKSGRNKCTPMQTTYLNSLLENYMQSPDPVDLVAVSNSNPKAVLWSTKQKLRWVFKQHIRDVQESHKLLIKTL